MSTAIGAAAHRSLNDDAGRLVRVVPAPLGTQPSADLRPSARQVAGEAADPWHRALYDEWVGRLGAAPMHGHLRALDEQFRQLLLLVTGDRNDEALRRRAHDVASTAGMLGFDEVTRCCRTLAEPGATAERTTRENLGHALQRACARLDRHFSDAATRQAA